MCKLAIEYFRNIFANDRVGTRYDNQNGEAGIITNEQNENLVAELRFDEFSDAIKQMHPDKSAGQDGFSLAFFQHFWELLGH